MAKLGLLVLALLALVSFSKAQEEEKETLKVASILSAPFLQLKSDDSAGSSNKDDYEGFVKDLLDELGHDYEFVIPEDGRYGQLDEATGTWSGTIGLAQEGKVDLIAADLTVSTKRQAVLDFSVPFMSSRLTILTKLGGDDSSGYPLIASPFDWTLWVVLLSAYLVAAFVFFLVKRISPHERIWSVNKARAVPDITLNESFWILIAAFFHASKPPAKACSSRLLMCGWWLFGVAVVAAYIANLASTWSLMDGACVQRSKLESVDEMLENPDFKFMLFQGGTTNQLLQSSSATVHRRIWERVVAHGDDSFMSSHADGVDKLKASNASAVGIVMEGSTADYVKPRHCGFYTVGQLDERHYAFAFPKGSERTATFSAGVLGLVESGKLQELKSRWWLPSDAEVCNDKTLETCEGFEPLEIEHLEGPLIFLVIVLVLALLASVLELLCHACEKKEPGITWKAIFARDIKEGCCGCVPVAGQTSSAKEAAEENA